MDIVINKTDSEKEAADKLKEFVKGQNDAAKISEESVFGILKDSGVDPLTFQKMIRDEWE